MQALIDYLRTKINSRYSLDTDPTPHGLEITIELIGAPYGQTEFLDLILQGTTLTIHDEILLEAGEEHTTLDLNDPNFFTKLDQALQPYYGPAVWDT